MTLWTPTARKKPPNTISALAPAPMMVLSEATRISSNGLKVSVPCTRQTRGPVAVAQVRSSACVRTVVGAVVPPPVVPPASVAKPTRVERTRVAAAAGAGRAAVAAAGRRPACTRGSARAAASRGPRRAGGSRASSAARAAATGDRCRTAGAGRAVRAAASASGHCAGGAAAPGSTRAATVPAGRGSAGTAASIRHRAAAAGARGSARAAARRGTSRSGRPGRRPTMTRRPCFGRTIAGTAAPEADQRREHQRHPAHRRVMWRAPPGDQEKSHDQSGRAGA